jgi:FixJ family two-component response regulator
MKAGAADFLSKPFDDQELFRAIEQARAVPHGAPRPPR